MAFDLSNYETVEELLNCSFVKVYRVDHVGSAIFFDCKSNNIFGTKFFDAVHHKLHIHVR